MLFFWGGGGELRRRGVGAERILFFSVVSKMVVVRFNFGGILPFNSFGFETLICGFLSIFFEL